MGRIPFLKPSEVMRILRNLGFELIRQKGSHCQFKHPDGRQTTVPDHRGFYRPSGCPGFQLIVSCDISRRQRA